MAFENLKDYKWRIFLIPTHSFKHNETLWSWSLGASKCDFKIKYNGCWSLKCFAKSSAKSFAKINGLKLEKLSKEIK